VLISNTKFKLDGLFRLAGFLLSPWISVRQLGMLAARRVSLGHLQQLGCIDQTTSETSTRTSVNDTDFSDISYRYYLISDRIYTNVCEEIRNRVVEGS